MNTLKPTGVILDQEQVDFIMNGLDQVEDATQEAHERCLQIAVANNLEDFEQTEKRHYSFSSRYEIIIVEQE